MDELILQSEISSHIYTIRGKQVMLDRDLAELYKVETKRLNEQVKRNIERFPIDFMFQLNESELKNWKSQFATSNKEIKGLRKSPFVFTEEGIYMLATVLKSKNFVSETRDETRNKFGEKVVKYKKLYRCYKYNTSRTKSKSVIIPLTYTKAPNLPAKYKNLVKQYTYEDLQRRAKRMLDSLYIKDGW